MSEKEPPDSEQRLWAVYAKTVKKTDFGAFLSDRKPLRQDTQKYVTQAETPALSKNVNLSVGLDERLDTPRMLSFCNPEQDKKLAKGEITLEARLDLHGCTLETAFKKFKTFIRQSATRGVRRLLVITGKGGRKRSSETAETEYKGVLKRELPRWAEFNPEIFPFIQSVTQAAPKHGGEGAYYVILKKNG